jgi:spermidine synthase
LPSSRPGPAGARLAAAALLLALSGAGALVVETTWMRWFRLLLGGTAAAASATLVAFFGGQALGAALGGRLARRWRRPLLAFAGLQALAAVAAAAVPALLGVLEALIDPAYDGLQARPAALLAARLAVALAAALPAAALLGATLPAFVAGAVGPAAGLGRGGALLYGLHTLGAAAGTALAAFWLPEALGVSGAYHTGLAALFAAAAGAAVLARAPRATAAPAARGGAPLPFADAMLSSRSLLALAAFSGFGSFAAQVLLVQSFALVLDQSTYAFGSVLVVVLAALALGAFGAAALDRAGRVDPRALLAASLGAAGLAFGAFPALFVAGTDGLSYLGTERAWPAYLVRALALAATRAGPALVAASLVFPLALALAARAPGPDGAGPRLGRLVAANTVGALLGALAGPWLLLAALGPWAGLAAVGAGYAAAALAVPLPSRAARHVRLGALVAGAVALGLAANPLAQPLVALGPGERLVHVDPTAAGVVAVVERSGERRIQTDNHYALGGSADRARQQRQGHVPLLLHGAPRRAAFLGAATGSTASAALAHGVERLTVVELVPGVARAARRWLPDAGGDVYDAAATRVVLDDARNFLRASNERWDVIVSDLFVPWQAGTGALYAAEHFGAARAHLFDGGLFCQWLPLYQLSEDEFLIVLATFLDVFPRAALFRGDFFGRHPIVALVGFRDAPPEPARVEAAVARLAAAGVSDRWVATPAGLWSLYVGPLAAALPALSDVPRNDDERPEIEFRAARRHAAGGPGAEGPFVAIEFSAFARQLASVAARHGDDLWPDLPARARRASQGGLALQAAGALFASGREREAARALAAAEQLLPPELVAAAPADPTAAELWRAD